MMRNFRHNPCLMSPLSAFVLLLLGLFTLVTVLVRIPEFLIGFLLAPIFQRSQWYIGKLLAPTSFC